MEEQWPAGDQTRNELGIAVSALRLRVSKDLSALVSQEEQRRAGNQTHKDLDIDVAVALAHVNSIVYCEMPNIKAWNCSRYTVQVGNVRIAYFLLISRRHLRSSTPSSSASCLILIPGIVPGMDWGRSPYFTSLLRGGGCFFKALVVCCHQPDICSRIG